MAQVRAPYDDLGEQRDQVAVAHRDHRVQVHVAARLGQVHRQHLRAPPGPEQRPGDPHHRLRGGALAHPDHHGAVADRLHVPALDVAAAPVLIGPAQPDRELLGREHRVEPVDRLHDHRLRHPGRLGHRVDRDAAEDPARRVALEHEVRQRRQQHARSGRPTSTPAPHPRVTSDLVIPPIRNSATSGWFGRLDPLPALPRGGDPDLPLAQDVAAYPVLGLGLGQRLGQQFLGVEHLDAAVAHHLHEHVVLGLGPGHPDHVIEQQLLGVGRGQAGVLQARPVHHDPAQPAHLGIRSQRHDGLLALR